MSEDFFDVCAFRKYIMKGDFKANKEDFNIRSFCEHLSDMELGRYLKDAFINQKSMIKVILIYGEGPETIICADLDKVKGMIKPQYLEYLK